MKRVILIQHESYEAVGTLDPLLREEGVRIRYVNFERTPDATPSLEGYDGLILMGGYMGVYEADRYAHLKTEMKLIEQALERGLPILGICLGSQILAHVLGSHVRKHSCREMGWQEIELTDSGKTDPVLGHFQPKETIFQSHGDTFDVPRSAVHLARSEACDSQAFRYGEAVYGLQFHLEIDRAIVQAWLDMPENQAFFKASPKLLARKRVLEETNRHLPRSIELSQEAFRSFLRVAGKAERALLLGSGHRD